MKEMHSILRTESEAKIVEVHRIVVALARFIKWPDRHSMALL